MSEYFSDLDVESFSVSREDWENLVDVDGHKKCCHDVSNKLAVITGYAELMLEDDNLNVKQKERLCAIVHSSIGIKNILKSFCK